MKLVVIESPLKGYFTRHRRYALWCAYHCRTLNEAAYASHLFYPQFLDDRDEDDRAFGIAAGLAWAAKADLRVFYVDLGWSDGMLYAANALGIDTNVRVSDKHENRCLPAAMYEKFERGEYPPATPGWESLLRDAGMTV